VLIHHSRGDQDEKSRDEEGGSVVSGVSGSGAVAVVEAVHLRSVGQATVAETVAPVAIYVRSITVNLYSKGFLEHGIIER